MYLVDKKFRYFIEGRSFTLFADHNPLTFAFSSVSISFLRGSKYTFPSSSSLPPHVRRSDNVVTDVLSRVSTEGLRIETIAALDGVRADVVDYAAIAKEQVTDIGVQILVSGPSSALQLVHFALVNTDERLLVDMSNW